MKTSVCCGVLAVAIGTFCMASAGAAAPLYTLTTLVTFNGTNGQRPVDSAGSLIEDASGNLYGTTYFGGANGAGTVFEITAGNHSLVTIASFNGTTAEYPGSGLTVDSNGNFYGTTVGNGTSNLGTVYEVAAGTHTLSQLVTFNSSMSNAPIGSNVTIDSGDNLYGTTSSQNGRVFDVAAGTHALTTVASFNGANGQGPETGVIADASGNLYGTTSVGAGTIFEVAAGTHVVTNLYSFPGGANGDAPLAGLVLGSNGNLYGTTTDGGANHDGTLFEFNPATRALTTLYSFSGQNGAFPEGSLIFGPTGDIFGTCLSNGTDSDGTVFEFDPPTSTYSTLFSFDETDGRGPYSGLLMDAEGNLYGTTAYGGEYDMGTVFELSPVPEPSTFVLALLVGVVCFAGRRSWTEATSSPKD